MAAPQLEDDVELPKSLGEILGDTPFEQGAEQHFCMECGVEYAMQWFSIMGNRRHVVPGTHKWCQRCAPKHRGTQPDIGPSAAELRKRAEAEERLRASVQNRFDRAIPPSLQTSRWDVFAANHSAIAEGLASWHHDPHGIFIYGSRGSGKSSATACLVRNLLEHDSTAMPVWRNTSIMLDEIRRTMNRPERTDDLIEQSCTAGVLVLDDLGVEKPSVWVLERLYVILQSRIDKALPTLITSNHTLPDLATWWASSREPDAGLMAGRLVSRINQLCRKVRIDGPDLRTLGGVA